MTKHTIELEGLQEGWEPVAFRKGRAREYFAHDGKAVLITMCETDLAILIIQKTKPRRIVLEETGESELVTTPQRVDDSDGLCLMIIHSHKVYRKVKEE